MKRKMSQQILQNKKDYLYATKLENSQEIHLYLCVYNTYIFNFYNCNTDKRNQNRPITIRESITAMKSLPQNICPGPDGRY